MTGTPVQNRLIFALDVPTVAEAEMLIEKLGGTVGVYKIGHELIFNGGLELAEKLIHQGKQVFLDVKLLDIGNTVERAVANIAGLGAAFLTIHGTDRKTLDAAVRGRQDADIRLLAITVLTNLEARDLEQQGITAGTEPSELALKRAQMAIDAGFDGIVCSGLEARKMRETLGHQPLVVTPGIRLRDDAVGDQNRVMTPSKAISNGASHLVVGRPISQAEEPAEQAMIFCDEIAAALRYHS